jgi:hypothetical protein
MTFPDAGMPPSTIGAYVEDMLNELAEMADRLNELDLATAIRNASVAAARANAKAWIKRRGPPTTDGIPPRDDED